MTASERAQAIAYGTRTVLEVEQDILYGKIVVAIQDAVREEREVCAEIAEHISDDGIVPDCSVAAITAAIRARK